MLSSLPTKLLRSQLPLLQTSRRPLSAKPEGIWPVVIVGGGPTGLTLSALLSKFGVPSLLLERSPALTEHPQAHFINCRTMEIFRQISYEQNGIKETLAQRVHAASPPLDQWRKFVYCQSLTGHVFGEVDHFKGQESARVANISPEGVTHLSQSKLLPMLLESATAHNVVGEVALGHHVRSIRPRSGKVDLLVDNREASYGLSCNYLVAADGANSRIRAALGIPMIGEPVMQNLINIHFWSPALARRLRIDRPAMLYFTFNSKAVVVIVAHDLNEGEFVAQIPFYPPVQQTADFTDAVCKELILAASGLEQLHIVVKSVRAWTMSAQVAQTFQAGNVFLAGDTAHRFPPAGGFGMNTGIQDAHNLAWKLAYVLGGTRLNSIAPDEPRPWAGSNLLATYTAERRPVAQANTELSVANFEEAMRVPKALGLDPAAARILSTAATAAYTALPGIGRRILEAGMAVGLAASGTEGPLRSWRSTSLKQIFESGASLRLQFPREDLGFMYNLPGCAVLPDASMAAEEWGAAAVRAHSHAGPSKDEHPEGYNNLRPTTGATATSRGAPYKPSTAPGSRLPHVDLHVMFSRAPSTSLLDLVGDQWVLLLSGSSPARVWSEAAIRIRAQGFPLRVVHIVRSTQAGKELCHLLKKYPAGGEPSDCPGGDAEYIGSDNDHHKTHGTGGEAKAKLSRKQREIQRQRKLTDRQVAWIKTEQWNRLRGVSEDGAVLVRPDGHVAWRCMNGPPFNSGSAGVNATQHRISTVLNALPGTLDVTELPFVA